MGLAPVALLGGPVLVLVLLRAKPSLDVRFFDPDAHLVVVSLIAACALAVAAAAAVAAARTGESAVVVVASGCLAVGVLMLGHGLLTPGVLVDGPNAWVTRLPFVALALFSAGLVLAARGRVPAVLGRRAVPVLAGVGLLLVAGLAALLAVPELGGVQAPDAERAVRRVVAALAAAGLVAATRVHLRRWRLGRDPVQVALALAASSAVAALGSLELGSPTRLSWWNYHGWLLAGFAAAAVAVFSRARGLRHVVDVVARAFDRDELVHLERGHPEALRTLVRAVEAKDAYTYGHSARVARLAVELGTRLRLPADSLRVLAQGGFLHDVGKVGVPDEVLNKPGRLDPEERAEMERHAALGAEMAGGAPSLAAAVPVIRHHHERWDGTGYPDALSGRTIPLLARVVAVADVWDALTSDRAYRAAWPEAEALAHILASRGSHLDPDCVDALVTLLAERGVRPGRRGGDAATATAAVADCHVLDEPALSTRP